MNVRLYLWQRLTAAVMAPLVLAHVIVIFYATRQGMSAADILARTRGSVAWASFYGLFVVAVGRIFRCGPVGTSGSFVQAAACPYGCALRPAQG